MRTISLINQYTCRDSLKLHEQKAELAELAGKYETENRDKQIELERAESKRQAQLKYFFMAGAVLLFLFALVLINRFIAKQSKQKITRRKKCYYRKRKGEGRAE